MTSGGDPALPVRMVLLCVGHADGTQTQRSWLASAAEHEQIARLLGREPEGDALADPQAVQRIVKAVGPDLGLLQL